MRTTERPTLERKLARKARVTYRKLVLAELDREHESAIAAAMRFDDGFEGAA